MLFNPRTYDIVKVSAIIERDGKILLINEWNGRRKKYLWNLVKGTYRFKNHETLLDCIKREGLEECLLGIEVEGFLGCTVERRPKFGHKIQFTFLAHPKAEAEARVPETRTNREHIREVKWFTRDEASSLVADDFASVHSHYALKRWLEGQPTVSIDAVNTLL